MGSYSWRFCPDQSKRQRATATWPRVRLGRGSACDVVSARLKAPLAEWLHNNFHCQCAKHAMTWSFRTSVTTEVQAYHVNGPGAAGIMMTVAAAAAVAHGVPSFNISGERCDHLISLRPEPE